MVKICINFNYVYISTSMIALKKKTVRFFERIAQNQSFKDVPKNVAFYQFLEAIKDI